jgi:peptidoglycan-N-acetylglucosamine deacetylase
MMPAQHVPAEHVNGLRRWRPAPFVLASLILHLSGLVVLALRSELWPWILSVLAGNHLVLLAAVLRPRGRLLGPNLVCLPESATRRRQVALTFDDGPDPGVTPQVLDLLDRYQAKASFFCIGEKAAAHPDIVREIARRGHSVENHTCRHPRAFALYGFSRLGREVDSAQAVIAGITGRAPSFFRAPAGFRSPFLDAVLAQRGIHHVSWTRRGFDAVSRNPLRVLQRLLRGLAAGDVLLLHDGSHARTDAGDPLVLAVLPALLDQLAANGLKCVSLPTACNADLPAQPAVPASSMLRSERQHRHA